MRYMRHMGGYWSLDEVGYRAVIEGGECHLGFGPDQLGRRLKRKPAAPFASVTDWAAEDYRHEMLRMGLLTDFRMKLGTLSVGGYWRRTGMALEVGQYVYFLERFDGKWGHAVVDAIEADGLVRASRP